MYNIYNEETPFYSRKKVDFLLADIGILIDFLVLEKKRPKCAALTVVGLPSWKKNKRNNPKNLIVLQIYLAKSLHSLAIFPKKLCLRC